MARTNHTTPAHFPTGTVHAATGDWVPGWKRTYPATMKLTADDHLAVASGAYRRWLEGACRFHQASDGRWVEDMSGVAFDDTDVGYLDWLCGSTKNATARWIGEYRTGAGASRFSGDVLSAESFRREAGWMYATLGTLMWWQAQRDRDSVESRSGFSADLDETPDDGWATGRTWGSADPNWTPERHDAHWILEAVREKARRAAGKMVWDADGGRYPAPHAAYTSHRAGEMVKVAAVTVVDTRGMKTLELPGRWAPRSFGFTTVVDTGTDQVTVFVPWENDGHECPQFLDRHAWDACLWAADELRQLYTRIVEQGPACVPDDADVGPVAWVYERVREVMDRVPTGDVRDSKLDGFRKLVRQSANACLDAVERIEVPVDAGFVGPVDELANLDLVELAKATERAVWGRRHRVRRVSIKRIRGFRSTASGDRVTLDVAFCQ